MRISNYEDKLYSPNFQQNKYTYCNDGCDYRIKSVLFDTPIRLDKAISKIYSDKTVVETLNDYKYFTQRILTQIKKDLSFNKELQNLKIKGMIDFGQTAFVFETENGDILKITSRDHFLGRKAEPFDLPVKTQGKLSPKSFCYYYIEDKISDLNDVEEMNQAIKEINESGFNVVDCEMRQFGKTKNGKVVLIDPECARKSGFWGLIKYKLAKIKAYIFIIK